MKRTQHKKGFTLIELLVVVAIISVLAGILFPVFARARENARRASCLSNLKQIGLGILQYTQDYDEHMPPFYLSSSSSKTFTLPNGTTSNHGPWYSAIYPYVKSIQVFTCPSASEYGRYDGGLAYSSEGISYAYNYKRPVTTASLADTFKASRGKQGIDLGCSDPTSADCVDGSASLASVEDVSGTIAITESTQLGIRLNNNKATEETLEKRGTCLDIAANGKDPRCLRARHLGSMNVAFVDGHVKSMPWKKILDYNNDDAMMYWTTASR